MKRLFCAFSVGLGCFLPMVPAAAHSEVFSERGDAGSLVGTAQTIEGGSTSISGRTEGADHEDLFRFFWHGGVFQAATDGRFGSSANFDTMLFLFDGSGSFIAANDDSIERQSFLSANLLSGTYLLGISGFRNSALNSGGEPFLCCATGTLTSWQNNGENVGAYVIGLNSEIESVPEPGTGALFGLSLAFLGFFRRGGVAAQRRAPRAYQRFQPPWLRC